MRIFVDKLPKKDTDCLFAIPDNRDLYPSICKLKITDPEDMIVFSMKRYCNCSLVSGKECPFLQQFRDKN